MKLFNYWYLSLVLLLSLGSHSCAQNKVTIDLKEDEKLIEFTTDRFTLPNLHVTPDGKNIIFDVLGDIYQVPVEGGKAEVLLQDNNWKRAGKLSPDGETLAYISDETGEFQVWTISLETQEKKIYPIKEFVHYPLYAYWRDDKHLLIPNKEGIHTFNVTSGKEQMIRSALESERSILNNINRTISINKIGKQAFFQKEGALWCYDLNKQIDLFIGNIPDNFFLEFIRGSSNGKKVLYYKKNKSDYSNQDLVYWNLTTNVFKILKTNKKLGTSTKLNYSFDFIDDENIILDKEGEIVRMNIETGRYESIPIKVDVKKIIKKPLNRESQYIKDSIITASVLRNPVSQSRLDTIYFGAFGKLHSYSKNTEQITGVYPNQDRFEISPSLSPNGEYLAYATWSDINMGHLYAREIATGKEYQLTKTPGRYINPAWSPNGKEIVFVADETEAKMSMTRQTGGTNTSNYYLDIHRVNVVEKGRIKENNESNIIQRITPMSIVPKRFYPIPVYHQNEKSIFISTRSKDNDLPTFIEIDLISKEIINEFIIPYHTDEVLISPNTEHIAFVYDDQVWVDTYPYSTKLEFVNESNLIPKKFHYKGGVVDNILLPNAKIIYEIAPSYLSWQDENILMWGSAEEIYTYDVRSEKTEQIANIDVKKSRAIPKTNYALTNAKIITINKNNKIIEDGTILVKDNRIQEVGKRTEVAIPENYKIFDLKGKTIIPGLIDAHAHYHHAPYEFQMQQNYKYIGNLAYGVTTIYDPSVNVLDYRERAQMVETGQLLGPRVFASGNIIDHYPAVYDYRTINSQLDTDKIVSSNKKLSVYSPLKQYNRKNRKHRKWLYNSAKKYNMTLTNHETDFILAMTQIIDGYTAMEHEKYTFIIHQDIIELIGQSGISYTPTFIISPGIKNIYSDITRKERLKLLSLNGKVLYNNLYAYSYEYKNNEHQEVINNWSQLGIQEHDRAIKALKDIMDVKGKVSVGGHGNPLPGIGTHWELWFMNKGMTNYQALQAATINGAEKLDLQKEIGSIEKGKLADMVVLNTDPLESIFNTTDIYYTIQNGNIYESKTMKQIHPIEKELKLWGWNSSTILKSMQNIHIK